MGLFNIFNKNKAGDNESRKSKYNFMSWEHRNPIQPETISHPNELKEGQLDLRLAITQLNISSSDQKKLIDEWCSILPKLSSVKHIFFYSRINQKILDSVSKMEQLESVFIKWSGNSIKSYQSLEKLKSIKRLYLGNSTTLEELSFLNALDKLAWIEIHEQKNLKSLEGFENLKNLQGFIMSGGIHGKQKIESLEPLKGLIQLKYLGIASTYVESENLNPISGMINLEYLDLPIYYPMEEFAHIANALPNCDHGLKAYRENGFTCSNCNKESMVNPMNKRSRQLCLNCDIDKIKELELKFEKLKQKSA